MGKLPKIASKGVLKFLYPKGIMKGPLNRGGAYIKWNGPIYMLENPTSCSIF
jgi:hypothetical protein